MADSLQTDRPDMQRPESPRVSRRRARNRELMLDIAEQKFAATGFAAVRIEEIAEEADVSIGSVYTHFGNKEGLFNAVAERVIDRAVDYLAVAYQASDIPIEQLAATGSAFLNFLLDYPFIVRFMNSASPDINQVDETAKNVRYRLDGVYKNFEATIDAAIAAGQARPIDSRLFARFLVGSWTGMISLSLQGETFQLPPRDVEPAVYQARAIILTGLCTPEFLATHDIDAIAARRIPRPEPRAGLRG